MGVWRDGREGNGSVDNGIYDMCAENARVESREKEEKGGGEVGFFDCFG